MSGLNGTAVGRGAGLPPPNEEPLIFAANMNAAMRSYYRRTKGQMIDPNAPMPFDRLEALEAPEDAFVRAIANKGDEPISEYEMQFMARGYRLAFDRIFEGGLNPLANMKRLFALGRQIAHPEPSSLTMTESGLMFSETKAAHSFRCKVLSGELKLAGAKGTRLPGQKSPLATPKYAAAATGNCNRKRKVRVRQGSFLAQLKTVKGRKTN